MLAPRTAAAETALTDAANSQVLNVHEDALIALVWPVVSQAAQAGLLACVGVQGSCSLAS